MSEEQEMNGVFALAKDLKTLAVDWDLEFAIASIHGSRVTMNPDGLGRIEDEQGRALPIRVP